MNIKKHGVLGDLESKLEEFKCESCGCEFVVNDEEYYIDKGSQFSEGITANSWQYSAFVHDCFVCSCPECYKIVTKTKDRTVTNPCITVGSSSTGIGLKPLSTKAYMDDKNKEEHK